LGLVFVVGVDLRNRGGEMRGFFGVAFYFPKTNTNIGSLMRTAHVLGADFFAIVGQRIKNQASNTMHSERHIPLFVYKDFEDFYAHIPYDTQLVGVELEPRATEVTKFPHPQRAVYLLGSEDNGLPERVLAACHHVVRLKGERSLNVACAGSIVLYDRVAKAGA